MSKKVIMAQAWADEAGRKPDKVKQSLEICFLFRRAVRSDLLCLVLHNRVDEYNHLPHGQL